MGKKLAYIAQATNIAKTLAFDIKPSIVVGLALHWSWVWLGFWSMACYSATPAFSHMPATIELVQPLWAFSLFANSVGLAVLFLLRNRLAPLGSHLSMPVSAALITAVSTFLVSWPIVLPANEVGNAIYIIAALLTGAGSAISFALWGELLTVLGMRQTVVYGVGATVVGSLLYFIGLIVGQGAIRVALVLMPIIGMRLYWTQRGLVSSHPRTPAQSDAEEADFSSHLISIPLDRSVLNSEEKASNAAAAAAKGADPSPKQIHTMRKDFITLLAVSLFFGTSYGLIKGLTSINDAGFAIPHDALNIMAFLVGALAIFLSMSVFKMNFKRLTYQVTLPFMAAGFVFLPLLGFFQIVGFFLHQLGYQYFYIVLWALWPAMARGYGGMPPMAFCCVSLTGMQAGQLLGSTVGAGVLLYSTDRFVLAMVAVVAVFIILLVALFGFGNTVTQSGWWMAQPMGEDRPAKFRRTCERIAANRGLSARETEVFMLLAKGRNCGYISKQLVISEPTTKTHMRNVYRKLGVHSQQALLDLVEFESK